MRDPTAAGERKREIRRKEERTRQRNRPSLCHSSANRAGRLLDLLCLNYHTEPLLNLRPTVPTGLVVRSAEKHSVAGEALRGRRAPTINVNT